MCRCTPKPVPFQIGHHTIYGTGFGFSKTASVSVKGFDLGVLLDWSAGSEFLRAAKPWKSPKVFSYEIRDMSVPDNMAEFQKLLDYLGQALKDEKKVIVGCIGGHGRTGLLLAALHHHLTQSPDGMKQVRQQYCKKAIETQKQIDWLHDNFGLEKVEPSKKYGRGKGNQIDWFGDSTPGFGSTEFERPGFYKGRKQANSGGKKREKPIEFEEGTSSLFDKTPISGRLW